MSVQILRQAKRLNVSWCHCNIILTNEIFQILNCRKTSLLIILIILTHIAKEAVESNSNYPSDALILSPVAKKRTGEGKLFRYPLIESILTIQI